MWPPPPPRWWTKCLIVLVFYCLSVLFLLPDLSADYLDVPFGRGGPGTPGLPGSNGQQRTKRMRTSFKHHQLRTMKSYFAINHNPDAKDLKQLSQKTGLPKRVLQVSKRKAQDCPSLSTVCGLGFDVLLFRYQYLPRWWDAIGFSKAPVRFVPWDIHAVGRPDTPIDSLFSFPDFDAVKAHLHFTASIFTVEELSPN